MVWTKLLDCLAWFHIRWKTKMSWNKPQLLFFCNVIAHNLLLCPFVPTSLNGRHLTVIRYMDHACTDELYFCFCSGDRLDTIGLVIPRVRGDLNPSFTVEQVEYFFLTPKWPHGLFKGQENELCQDFLGQQFWTWCDQCTQRDQCFYFSLKLMWYIHF